MWNYNFYVYIITNVNKTVLYIGVTNNLDVRLAQHHENAGNPNTFAGKYHCHLLLYYEHFSHINDAIAREKELKKWSRVKKELLIATTNPEWRFLNKDVES
jgi:putative endonuclease